MVRKFRALVANYIVCMCLYGRLQKSDQSPHLSNSLALQMLPTLLLLLSIRVCLVLSISILLPLTHSLTYSLT